MRLFVAVDLEPPILEQLDRLIAQERRRAPKGRWLKRDQLHLTLVFLGEVASEQVAEVGARITGVGLRHAPLVVSVESAGGFPDVSRPRVLWLGFAGDTPPLGTLQADLALTLQDFVSEPESRAFVPHLTLARSAQRGGDAKLGACASALQSLVMGPSTIREIVLYESHLSSEGARYTARLRAPLVGAAAPGAAP